MTTTLEYARCTCGGEHGIVPVYAFVNERGRTERWCVEAWNARFSECPGCKARRKDGRCPRECRQCAKHGWHEGSCPACRDARSSSSIWDALQAPMTLAGSILMLVIMILIAVLPVLLALPFLVLGADWFVEAADLGDWVRWVLVIGPVKIAFAIVVLVVVVASCLKALRDD